MIKLKLDVTKIDKTAIFEGRKGKYLDLTLVENRDGTDQFRNDGFVAQDLSKERREAGEKGPIIGNWKTIGGKPAPKPAPRPAAKPAPDLAPDDDGMDF